MSNRSKHEVEQAFAKAAGAYSEALQDVHAKKRAADEALRALVETLGVSTDGARFRLEGEVMARVSIDAPSETETPLPIFVHQDAEPVSPRSPLNVLQVGFDDPTWAQVEDLAVKMGTTRGGLVRRAVRILAVIVCRLDDGYKVTFLKKGEDPVVLEWVG